MIHQFILTIALNGGYFALLATAKPVGKFLLTNYFTMAPKNIIDFLM
jgi:hypothetical protein